MLQRFEKFGKLHEAKRYQEALNLLEHVHEMVEWKDGAPHLPGSGRCGSFGARDSMLSAMPLGLRRYQQSGHSHFVTFSCYHRLPYLGEPDLRDAFLSSLERTRRRYRFLVYGYVLMPEHVHLLASEPESDLLATAIQALKISVARWALTNLHISPLWQKRYYDHNVRDCESFDEKLRYIHRNPVKRGLCAEPADWRWSSFRHYITAEVGLVEIESQWTAMRREGQDPHLPTPGRCGAPWGLE